MQAGGLREAAAEPVLFLQQPRDLPVLSLQQPRGLPGGGGQGPQGEAQGGRGGEFPPAGEHWSGLARLCLDPCFATAGLASPTFQVFTVHF